jgi:hypothetical protein
MLVGSPESAERQLSGREADTVLIALPRRPLWLRLSLLPAQDALTSVQA